MTSPPTPAPKPRTPKWHWLGVPADAVHALFWTLVALLLVVTLALWFLFDTSAGLRTIRNVVNHYGEHRIHVGAVSGRLLDAFTLDDVRYDAADGTRVTIGRVHLDWDPTALLVKTLHVRVLNVHALHLQLPKTSPSKQKSKRPTRFPERLPLGVRVEALHVDDLQLRKGEAKPFAVTSASFSGSWIGRRLRLRELDADLPRAGPVQLTGQATTAPDAIDIALLRLTGPGAMEVRGTLGFGAQASDLHLDWDGLHWPVEGKRAGRLARGLHGRARLRGTLDAYRLTLETRGRIHDKPLQVHLRASGSRKQARIGSLALEAGKAGSASAQGTLRWAPRVTAEIDVTFDKLDPGVFVAGWNGTLNGNAQAHTRVDEGGPKTVFTVRLDRSTLRGYPLALSAKGATTPGRVKLDSLTLTAAKGSVQAQGNLAWSAGEAWRLTTVDLQLALHQLDPAVFAPQWPGSIDGQITLRTGKTGAQATPLQLIARLNGSRLRGKPLTLDARASLQLPRAGHWNLKAVQAQVDRFDLALGDAKVTAEGRASPPFDLHGHFSGTNLGVFDARLGGRLAFDFRLQGSLDDPHLLTRGEGAGLRMGARRVQHLRWTADVDPLHPSTVDVTLNHATIGHMKIERAKLHAEGIEKYQHIRLDASSARGTLALALSGGFDRQRREWGGQIVSFELAPKGLPVWTLQNAPGLLLGRRRISLESTCLAGDAGRICLNLQNQAVTAGLTLAWEVESLRLAAFKPMLPKKTGAQGDVNGAGYLRWVGGDVNFLYGYLNLDQGRVTLPDAAAIHFKPSRLTLIQQNGVLHARLDLSTQQARVEVTADAAPAARFIDRPLSGQAHVSVPDLASLQPFVTGVQSLTGHVDGNLRLGGSLGKPRITGQVVLAGAGARLPAAGITLTDVRLALSGQGDGPLAVTGNAASGGGQVRLKGSIDPTKVPVAVALTVEGKDFQVMNTPDARIWATPDLTIKRGADGIDLAGTLTVPKAEITPRRGIGTDHGVGVSPDQVIVGVKPRASPPTPPVHVDLALVLGKQVRFSGYGLKAGIRGGVVLRQEPKGPALAQGELRLVDGRYKAYGQDLTIETGRLIFDGGPVTSPGLDFLAVRKPREDIEVGVQVRGTLDQPRLSLTSKPGMPRDQQLSWLLFGHPMEENSSGNQNAIAAAALSLGLSGGDYFVNRIGSKLGLDTVSLGGAVGGGSAVAANPDAISGSLASQGVGGAAANGAQAAQLTLGKYLTPRLYVSYGVSLFQPGQVFRLLYDLGHGFKLQTESGTSTGGDLLYTFEGGD